MSDFRFDFIGLLFNFSDFRIKFSYGIGLRLSNLILEIVEGVSDCAYIGDQIAVIEYLLQLDI